MAEGNDTPEQNKPHPIDPKDMSPEDRASLEKILAEPGFRMMQQVVNLKDDPRILILVSHGFLELMINALIDHKLKNSKRINSDSRNYPHSIKLLILNEVGVLPDKIYKAFDHFRKLRNKAAHEPLFKLTREDLAFLSPPYSDPANFHDAVVNLVLGFWNRHTELFVKVFLPSQHREEGTK